MPTPLAIASEEKRMHVNEEITPQELSKDGTKRRSLMGAIAAGVGGATFFGPWKENRVWAQAAQKKPLVIGLTMDASGQYAASGVEERLGAMMAIKEFNDKGGVLGR
ncbi:MAG: ABC transporter substrate-binding protein, partial [Casimicrobiaceae bacterium]